MLIPKSPLVLIVEDSAVIALAYQQALVEEGLRAAMVASPNAALRAAEAETPAVAVVDLALQDAMDGAELAKTLVARGIPVVLATGMAGGNLDELVRTLGASAALDKPVPGSRLVETVRSVLGRTEGLAAARPDES